MTLDQRVEALMPLGFSERQTRFLVTVALHSGFCLRRHYTQFAGLQYGQGIREFFDRLVRHRLASSLTFRRDRGRVYHLHASRLYAAIGQDDNRNRRATSPALVARKLMLLDYVLGTPPTDWYATEQDKVALFVDRFGIPFADLPQRCYRSHGLTIGSTTRFFIHKLPISVGTGPAGVSFVFLVTDTTGRGFVQFLADHARLLTHLAYWRFVAVCPQHLHGLAACETAFRQFIAGPLRRQPTSDVAALRQYFVARELHERGQIAQLPVAEIDAFRAARRRYIGPAFERAYSQWRQDGDAALVDDGRHRVAAAVENGRGDFVTHRLPLRYDRFGTRAGLS